MQELSLSLTARPAIEGLQASRIRDIVNAGLGRSDLVTFWLGEPDEVTPDFIRNAGIASLQRGETFYTHNLGIPELRMTDGPIGVRGLNGEPATAFPSGVSLGATWNPSLARDVA